MKICQCIYHEFENTPCPALEYVFHCHECLGNALDFYHAIVVYTLIKVHSVSAAVRNTSNYFNTNTLSACRDLPDTEIREYSMSGSRVFS